MEKSTQKVPVQVTEQRLVTIDLNQINCKNIDPTEIPALLEAVDKIRNDIDPAYFKKEQITILRHLCMLIGTPNTDGDIGGQIDNFFAEIEYFDALFKNW